MISFINNCSCDCVSLFCVGCLLCVYFVYCVRLIVVLFCVMSVVCVLCLIVVPLPPGENPFAVKINKNKPSSSVTFSLVCQSVSLTSRRCTA
jgi:hypothetical protein